MSGARHLSFPSAAPLAAVLSAYFVAAASALYVFGDSTPIWYSNAFVIVALLHQPVRTWPTYVLGAAIADMAAMALFSSGTSPLLAVADVLEILLVAGGIQATGGVRHPQFRGTQVGRVVLACTLGPIVSGALGGWIISSELGVPFAAAWQTWYTASALGLLVVAPFVLSWLDPELRQLAFGQVSRRGALVLAVAACAIVFLLRVEQRQEVLFLTFPIIFALTWAYGLPGATVGMVTIAFSAVYGTLHGSGALIELAPRDSLNERIGALQLYLVAVLLSSLPLALLHARQRELSANVKRSSEARSEFLAAMSHEIRTPMTGVLGMLDLMASENLTASQRRYVDVMRSSGRHLLSIINDILDFSRIESGKLQVEKVDFSVAELMESLRSLAHPLAVERGVALEVEAIELEADVLRGDPLRLLQVLLNLVGNAIKFTERGSVRVSVTQRPESDGPCCLVMFKVRDTGIGIEPAKLPLLFEPFTQADRSISREYGGTGLGLVISQRLVHAMGGQIAVSSVPRQGSVFSFELRLPPGDRRSLVSRSEGHQIPSPPRRILVAEDVEINREILGAALKKQGHAVVFAHDGAQALHLVAQQQFDLVLMDVQMPVLDGVEATRRIRQMPPPLGSLPIIGLTANVMAREREHYLAAGMDACLGKPIEWQHLNAAIRDLGAGRDGPAAEAPGGADAGSALLDDQALNDVRRLVGDEFDQLLTAAISSCERHVANMEAAGVTAEAMFADAHKMKGSAGTLGLQAIYRLAAAIEDAAAAGETPTHLVQALRRTLAASRAELAHRDFAAVDQQPNHLP